MASLSRHLLLFLLLNSILLVDHTAKCEDDEDDHDHEHDHDHDQNHPDKDENLLQGINSHRASLKLNALTKNDIAECLADEMADQFKHQPCTGPNTVPAGIKPQLSNYPSLLAKCGSNPSIVRDGVILPACVPNLVPNLVLSSYTTSPQYSQYLNDGKFSGIGVATEDNNWIVVVLTTNTPLGSSGGRSRGSGLPDKEEDDEEDILLQGINSFRASLNLSALTENDKAECLADEIADQFNDQPCRSATSSYPAPGSQPQILSYRRFLAKCEVNVATTKDGVILPVCVPNLAPNLVLSNYTTSQQYSRYLRDTKFTGIGIGTEDNWMVIVLTTNTSGGSFIASQNVGYANVAVKLDPVYHVVVLLIIGFLVMLQ